ncbi:SDR family NAD(P)-dependent oxidoreductase [Nocardioides bruguierae]|uniref:SDR family NAD(P)-dependent oxidoreductase n=1 Tax=Nocardioides bruguierae TaxID=2945102 RepID=A0A9X2D6S1_9ACTN|nr:SDR family NAD(P)-dependent oxidoreductase [Nocardioides bruguierae]MCL8024988.1 SDR family NAD(P)-dependent oxidoreductase [Nocardioides bruguierae]MCM0620206.1 SDR family NAD(P)-dependent oxidoreductase [Nocardioides bruguierae]
MPLLPSAPPLTLPDLTGSTYVVTGANSGLGLETTRALVGAGAHVVLAVRDTERGRQAAASVTGPGSTQVRALDLADLSSVHAFADAWDGPIAGLACNAGIMMVPEGRTADGFERQMGTNHLGHFALVNLLLPRVTDRVVAVSSLLHRGPQVDLDDLELAGGYTPTRAYQASKLANLLFVLELDRRLVAAGSPVRALAAHPGYAATHLQSHHASRLAVAAMAIGNAVVATSAAEGARPTLMALTDDLPGNTFVGPTRLGGTRGAPGPVGRSAEALDTATAARLWEVSEARTGVTWPL